MGRRYMIQVKLGQLLNMIPTLQKLSEIPNSSGRMLYKISKLILKINQEAESFNTAKRGMLKRYGVLDEHGEYLMGKDNDYLIKAQLKNDFNNEVTNLVNTMVDVDIDYFVIEDFDNLGLTPQELISLMSLIKEK